MISVNMHYLLYLQDNFNESKGRDKSVKPVGKISFLKNIGLFLGVREKITNNFKSRIFPMKDEIPTSEHE